jgi:NADH-quinone oxidoreductase subunit L
LHDPIWLIPALPLAGFLILALSGGRLKAQVAAGVGCVSVGLSMAAALVVLADFIHTPTAGLAYSRPLWTWFAAGGLACGIGFYLDSLSLVMTAVITVVAFLIHLYSVRFMEGENKELDSKARYEGYGRFFAYMNLFVASMLILVLADNLLLLYLGWEAVGLCSYLLIGFWYGEAANARAAVKAFVVTRIGDTALIIGLFLLASHLGSLQIQEVMQRAGRLWVPGSLVASAAAALLLGGAVGKSAQIPLQVWLPDAMAGPTPVSALIHAATMVTAGVYLISRMHPLFTLAPDVLLVVAVIGALTLLIAAGSACVQRDIKRALAYSTMSQVGYMFLALGVGAWSAAIFHLVTHAFFKALLFLSAGVVIQALGNEHDIFRMGGLRKTLPAAFWTFLIGAASLSALPFVTAGFYSKDLILRLVWSSPRWGPWFWGAGALGAFLTALYSFRLVFLVFFGPGKAIRRTHAPSMIVPLVLLAVFSLGAGFLPRTLGALARALSPGGATGPAGPFIQAVGALLPVIGIAAAGLLYLTRRRQTEALATKPFLAGVYAFLFSGWGFDRLYRALLVDPFLWITRINRADFVDLFFRGLAWTTGLGSRALVATQSGKVRWYVMGVAIGGAVFIAMAVFL